MRQEERKEEEEEEKEKKYTSGSVGAFLNLNKKNTAYVFIDVVYLYTAVRKTYIRKKICQHISSPIKNVKRIVPHPGLEPGTFCV